MPDDDAFRKGLALASRVGVEMVVATIAGAGLGYFTDRWLDTAPWFLVVGVVLGGVAGFLGVYRLVSKSS